MIDDFQRLIDFVKSGEGETVVVCPSDDRVIAVICRDDGIVADYFRVSHETAREAVRDLKQSRASWADLPVLRVTTDVPDLAGAAINAAPVIYAIWKQGDGWYIDELCETAHAEDGNWFGTGATLVQPFVRREGQPVERDSFFEEGFGAGASTAAFEDWFKAAQLSQDSRVRDFGATLERTFIHMKDHDLEGNYTGEGPDPEEAEDMEGMRL